MISTHSLFILNDMPIKTNIKGLLFSSSAGSAVHMKAPAVALSAAGMSILSREHLLPAVEMWLEGDKHQGGSATSVEQKKLNLQQSFQNITC